MKQNNIIIAFVALAMICIASSCTQYEPAPRGEDMTIPAVVTNIKVENLPGKVKLTYQLPDDPSLLYVKAVYLLNSGVQREIKASLYTNTMILDGFGDTDIHEIKLYSVSKTEVHSEPLVVEVNPLENPIWDVFRSLHFEDDFGGLSISAENAARENVVIEIGIKDEEGQWASLTNIETQAAVIERTQRGMDVDTYELSATVRDRFFNYTDTTYFEITPLFEVEIDKANFQEMSLPGDTESSGQGWLDIKTIWDGISDIGSVERFLSVAKPDDPEPQMITFDMGVKAKLSRFVCWGYGYDGGDMVDGRRQFYIGEHMRYFEIWGSNNFNPDGSLSGWTLLGEFENVKPSGLPEGQQTVEDYDKGANGFEYTFEGNMPAVRYIRIRNIESWEATTRFGIVEIALFGDPRNEE